MLFNLCFEIVRNFVTQTLVCTRNKMYRLKSMLRKFLKNKSVKIITQKDIICSYNIETKKQILPLPIPFYRHKE